VIKLVFYEFIYLRIELYEIKICVGKFLKTSSNAGNQYGKTVRLPIRLIKR
jgi:hypothetical protein